MMQHLGICILHSRIWTERIVVCANTSGVRWLFTFHRSDRMAASCAGRSLSGLRWIYRNLSDWFLFFPLASRIYLCHFCSKEFSTRSALTTHFGHCQINEIRKPNDEKPKLQSMPSSLPALNQIEQSILHSKCVWRAHAHLFLFPFASGSVTSSAWSVFHSPASVNKLRRYQSISSDTLIQSLFSGIFIFVFVNETIIVRRWML